jgi:hypothetical protein
VALAVVLDAESRLRVGQVEPSDHRAGRVSNAVLENRRRQALLNQSETKPCLHRRVGSRRGQRQDAGQPAGSVPTEPAIVSVGGDRGQAQSADVQERVHADYGLIDIATAREVERSPNRRGHWDAVQQEHVGRSKLRVARQHPGTAGYSHLARHGDFHLGFDADDVGAEQVCGAGAADRCTRRQDQRGRTAPDPMRELECFVDVHVLEEAAPRTAPELSLREKSNPDRLGAPERTAEQ